MSLAIGSLTQVAVGSTTDQILAPAATSGTAPYTYQYYRSTASGFTPGGDNIITGATALALSDSGLTPGTTYYYKVVATDSAGTPATATSAQLTVVTTAATPSQNQFAQTAYLGMTDLRFNGDTLAVQFDPAGTGTLSAGQSVKFSTTGSGIPRVVPCTATSDVAAGYVNYNIKNASFAPGDTLEISMAGNVMFLYATAAINRGTSLTNFPAGAAGGCNGGVAAATGSSGFPIIGYALDTATSGALMRVFLQTPAAPYAID